MGVLDRVLVCLLEAVNRRDVRDQVQDNICKDLEAYLNPPEFEKFDKPTATIDGVDVLPPLPVEDKKSGK